MKKAVKHITSRPYRGRIDKSVVFRLGTLTGLIALLLVGTLMPGALKSQIEGSLWHSIPWSAAAHFCLFGAIAWTAAFGGRIGFLRALVLAAVLAGLTETLQGFVPGRHPLWRDVGIDMAGAVLGLALRAFLVPVRARAGAAG
jgi:hypothetical protein